MTRAIMYQQYGGPDVLRLTDVDAPTAGKGEARVRVKAAGVNPMDIKLRSGAMKDSMPVDFPSIPGSDVAGVVDQVGADVHDIAVGDEVVGVADKGAYAESAIATRLYVKPEAVSWEQAAAFPTAAATAHRVLGELQLMPGETLLIHGIAGSVGALTAQLATSRGVTVVGTCRREDVDYVDGLGATAVARGDGWVDRVRAVTPNGVDAVLDTAGAGLLPDSVTLAGGTDRVTTITDTAASEAGVRFSAGTPDDISNQGLPELLQRAARGELSVRVWRTYALAEAGQAQQAVEDHEARGKVILTP